MRWIRFLKSDSQTTNNKFLIVADCSVSQKFIDILEKELNLCGDLVYIDTSRKTKTRALARHFSYFLLALYTIFKRKYYKFIIFWQQFIGVYFSLIARVLNVKYPPALMMALIFKERKGVLGRLLKMIYNLAFQYKVIMGAICYSSFELGYYQSLFPQVKNKFLFVPYGQSTEDISCCDNIDPNGGGKPYFFSGGVSNRDYLTLLSVAKNFDFLFVIACKHRDIKGVKIPPNVKVFYEVSLREFDKLLKKSFGVILLFKDPNISSGQIVLLKAMEFGKPIIVTRSAGVIDYVDESCAFLVEHKDGNHLRLILKNVISNLSEARARGINAQKRYRDKFTIESFAVRVSKLIKENFKKAYSNDSILRLL